MRTSLLNRPDQITHLVDRAFLAGELSVIANGISAYYTPKNDPAQAEGLARVRVEHEALVAAAALDCPGECIFIEP